MITSQQVFDLLSLENLTRYCQRQAEGAVLGMAADAAATDESDWGHTNELARYLLACLGNARVCVDYTGVTVVGECEEILFDEGTLFWAPCLLRVLDIVAAGARSGMAVTREQVLAVLAWLSGWQKMEEHAAARDGNKEGLSAGVGGEGNACRARLQEEVDLLAPTSLDTRGYHFLGKAIAQGVFPSPTTKYPLEALLGCTQDALANALRVRFRGARKHGGGVSE